MKGKNWEHEKRNAQQKRKFTYNKNNKTIDNQIFMIE